MSQATLSVRLDSIDKKQFEEFCNDVGLNISAAINLFVKTVIKKQRIPFEIESDPFYSETNMNRLRKAITRVEAGHYAIHEPTEAENDACLG